MLGPGDLFASILTGGILLLRCSCDYELSCFTKFNLPSVWLFRRALLHSIHDSLSQRNSECKDINILRRYSVKGMGLGHTLVHRLLYHRMKGRPLIGFTNNRLITMRINNRTTVSRINYFSRLGLQKNRAAAASIKSKILAAYLRMVPSTRPTTLTK